MILIDNNLSPKLATRLGDVYPGIKSVFFVGLEAAPDEEIWQFAKSEGLAVLTKDKDFNLLFARFGYPPKVIRLDLGNISTIAVEHILRSKKDEILSFLVSPNFGILAIQQ